MKNWGRKFFLINVMSLVCVGMMGCSSGEQNANSSSPLLNNAPTKEISSSPDNNKLKNKMESKSVQQSKLDSLNGFQDLYWGESLEEVQKTHRIEGEYHVPQRNSIVHGIILQNEESRNFYGLHISHGIVMGSFWENKLTEIYLFFHRKDVFNIMNTELRKQYGKPYIDSGGHVAWLGKTTMIGISKENPDMVHLCSIDLFAKATNSTPPKY